MSTDAAKQLIDGIRNGMIPRQVRLFAAQGLLPVSREDLLRIQLLLSADPDPELSGPARKSVGEAEPETVVTAIRASAFDPIELDILVRLRQEETVWAAVAASRSVSNETLRILASRGGSLVQDIIVTNQVRLLGCLEILEDLRGNSQVTQVVLRRVKEFEEEFIDKAIAAAGELEEPEPGPSLEDALVALKAIGAHIPAEDELPYPPPPEPEPEPVDRDLLPVHTRLYLMTTFEKIMTALKGTREERAVLIMSQNRLVARSVLASPKLSEVEIQRFASSKSVSEEVIHGIAGNPRWMQKYPIALAISQNPKTPYRIAVNILPRLNFRDLDRVAKDRNVPTPVRRQAQFIRQRRR
jgi:hypothetical protein